MFIRQKLREAEEELIRRRLRRNGGGGSPDTIGCSPCAIPKTGTMTYRYAFLAAGATVACTYIDDFFPSPGLGRNASQRGYWASACADLGSSYESAWAYLFCDGGANRMEVLYMPSVNSGGTASRPLWLRGRQPVHKRR